MTTPNDYNPDKRPTRHDQMAMITNEVAHVAKRLEWLADHYLPTTDPEQVRDTVTDRERFGIDAIEALEEEWIIDPAIRAQASIITYVDDDDD